MKYPIKLNDSYTCQGHDADGEYVTFNDLLDVGDLVGHLDDNGDVFPPLGIVVQRDDGLWVVAEGGDDA